MRFLDKRVIIFIIAVACAIIFVFKKNTSHDLLRTTSSHLVFSAQNNKGTFRLYLAYSGNIRELKTVFNGDCITPVFSPDGEMILYAEHDGHDFELSYYDVSKKISQRLTNNDYDDYAPNWSPDQKRIVWSQVPEKSVEEANNAEIFVSTWPSFREHRLTYNDRMDAYPVFTSDCNAVIVESGRVDSLFGIFKLDLDGTETPLVYNPEFSGNGIPHVSGDFIVFERTEIDLPNILDIYAIQINSPKQLLQITNWLTHCNPTPRFSPSGLQIAGHRVTKDGCQITVIQFPFQTLKRTETTLSKTADYYRLPRWNRDGTLVAAEDVRNKTIGIFDLSGNQQIIDNFKEYRSQRFMEIYNFDIY